MNKNIREPEVEDQFGAWQCDACGAEVSFKDTTCSGCGADISNVADDESISRKLETETNSKGARQTTAKRLRISRMESSSEKMPVTLYVEY